MNQFLAYQIGAVFLLCALLMFSKMSGFLPNRFRLGAAPVVVGLLGLIFMLYRYRYEILSYVAPPGGAIAYRRADPGAGAASRQSRGQTN